MWIRKAIEKTTVLKWIYERTTDAIPETLNIIMMAWPTVKIILIYFHIIIKVCDYRSSGHYFWYCLEVYIIIIIIMSCRQHGYPWPSLPTFPDRSSPPTGLQGYIPYPHIAAVCMFELVFLLLLGHMQGSIGVHHLWARPCFSSSVLHVLFV